MYKTKDLWQAAALISLNIKLNSIVRENNICYFLFENEELAQQLSKEYFFGSLKVDAYKYQEAVAKLKREIFR
jgi:hypothetical protein